jgi:acetamidase/formamidase
MRHDQPSPAPTATEPQPEPGEGASRFVPSIPDNLAYGWFDPSKKPVLEVESGERVTVDCLPSWTPELEVPAPFFLLDDHIRALAVLEKGPGPHLVTGPIAVCGAEPGDVLEVAIEDVSLRQDWGWSGVWPGQGALPHRFSEKSISFVPLDRGSGTATLRSGATIPLRPFFGILAVAPPLFGGRVSTVQPGGFGGNIDNRELVAGTSLFLPVWNPGASFFVGDGHAAQGDGEVSQTGLETALRGRFRLTLWKATGWTLPRAVTSADYVAMGFDSDLDVAVEIALDAMLDWIVELTGMAAVDAWSLFSFVGSLRITQVVDGKKGVHAMIARALIDGLGAPRGQSRTPPDTAPSGSHSNGTAWAR